MNYIRILIIAVQGKSLGKGGVAPVLMRSLSLLTVPFGSPVSKVGEYCCLTTLAFSRRGFPQELRVSHAWVHDNTCNNRVVYCMVPRSCRLCKRGT